MRVQKITSYQNKCVFKANKKAPAKKKEEHGAIFSALEELKKIKFENNDLIFVSSIGAKPPFQNGLEAYKFIKEKNIKIAFAPFVMNDVHASYDHTQNRILINEKYKNSKSFPEILALSEAIFHECGHGKDGDIDNSIQEELDCLSLNVLGHKFHKNQYNNVFQGQNSSLFSQGVNLYEQLFYKYDPQKNELKTRISHKYGFLPVESKNHPASEFASKIKAESTLQ